VKVFATLLVAAALAAPAAGADLRASAALLRSLERSGRAEATLRFERPDATGGQRVVHATLALEPPVRARLDVLSSGEKIVARGDGGEWLQPATKQLLRFRAEQAAPALHWWRVLIAHDRSAREREVEPAHFVLTLLDQHAMPQDSADVWLDAHGLPSRLRVPAGDPEGALYRLANWRFSRARGEAVFRLAAPSGYETVDLP
jgi:hypothetical protein